MKKSVITSLKVFMIAAFIFVSTGCMKMNVEMEITKDKKMNLSIIQAVEKSSIEELSDIIDDSEIAEYEDNGFYVQKYSEDTKVGFQLTKTFQNIDDISTEFTIDGKVTTESLMQKDKPIFTIKKGFFKNTYVANFNTSSLIDTNIETDDSISISNDSMDLEFEVKLPYKAISHNATNVNANGTDLIWNLAKTSDVSFEFELYNMTNIYIVGGVGILVLILIISTIVRMINSKPKGNFKATYNSSFNQATENFGDINSFETDNTIDNQSTGMFINQPVVDNEENVVTAPGINEYGYIPTETNNTPVESTLLVTPIVENTVTEQPMVEETPQSIEIPTTETAQNIEVPAQEPTPISATIAVENPETVATTEMPSGDVQTPTINETNAVIPEPIAQTTVVEEPVVTVNQNIEIQVPTMVDASTIPSELVVQPIVAEQASPAPTIVDIPSPIINTTPSAELNPVTNNISEEPVQQVITENIPEESQQINISVPEINIPTEENSDSVPNIISEEPVQQAAVEIPLEEQVPQVSEENVVPEQQHTIEMSQNVEAPIQNNTPIIDAPVQETQEPIVQNIDNLGQQTSIDNSNVEITSDEVEVHVVEEKPIINNELDNEIPIPVENIISSNDNINQ